MTDRLIVVKAAYDPEAKVWYVNGGDVPGLAAEADTIEGLVERLPGMIADLIEEGNLGDLSGAGEIPIEIIAHASARVSVTA
jgi:hypothetical protein